MTQFWKLHGIIPATDRSSHKPTHIRGKGL